ncbi:MAG: hypothetical protein JWL77_7138 [Chthonomonadaceae bacterium]|nr:hypothetical protein [Chthonomonadaceae bacterium]
MSTTPAPFSSIVIRMAKLAASGAVPAAQDDEDLALFIETQSGNAEFSDPDETLQVDSQYPGYLWRDGPSGRIYVPFNLAAVFPRHADLESIVDVAEKVLLAAGDPLCISGSTTFLGRFTGIGDLDFCEYYLPDPSTLPAAISPKTQSGDPPLIWVKCGGKYRAPWAGLDAAVSASFTGQNPARLKLDFVTDGSLGLLPTTSVVLATTSGEDGAADQSFAYQEAVILGLAPVRVLVSAKRLGTYADWLRSEVRKLVEGTHEHQSEQAPIKALKRCLSLLLMLGRFDEAETVLKELANTVLADVVFAVRLDELRQMANDYVEGGTELAARIAEIGDARPLPSRQLQQAALASANDVAISMLMDIDAWFEEVA